MAMQRPVSEMADRIAITKAMTDKAILPVSGVRGEDRHQSESFHEGVAFSAIRYVAPNKALDFGTG